MDGEKLSKPQPCTKNYRPRRNAKSRRNSLTQEEQIQLVIQYQMVSPENIYTQVTSYILSRLYLSVLEYIHTPHFHHYQQQQQLVV